MQDRSGAPAARACCSRVLCSSGARPRHWVLARERALVEGFHSVENRPPNIQRGARSKRAFSGFTHLN
eukprot:scaffold94541_cov69-Phaeocystis_antarctica.AAC.7